MYFLHSKRKEENIWNIWKCIFLGKPAFDPIHGRQKMSFHHFKQGGGVRGGKIVETLMHYGLGLVVHKACVQNAFGN